MSMPPQLRLPASLRRRALMFVLPVLAGITLLLTGIFYRQGAFESYDDVTFSIDSASGLSRGMPVKLKGLMVGHVKEMNPKDTGKDTGSSGQFEIVVTMLVKQRYMSLIPRDSTVTLAKEQLIMGQSFIEILPGSDGGKVAKGGSLDYHKQGGLKDIIDSVSEKAKPILNDVGSFSKMLVDSKEEIRAGIRNTVALTHEFPEMGRQVIATARATREMAEGVKTHSTEILGMAGQEMPVMIGKVGETLDNVKATSLAIRQISQELRPPVLEIVEDGRHTSAEVRQIVGSAKQSWPLNAILPRPAHESVLPDSAAGVVILQPRQVP